MIGNDLSSGDVSSAVVNNTYLQQALSLNDLMTAAAMGANFNSGLNLHNLTTFNNNNAMSMDPNVLAQAILGSSVPNNGTNANAHGAPQKVSAEYLSQLLRDKKNVSSLPNVFGHVERLVDDEIAKVRTALFHLDAVNKEALVLPEPSGDVVTLQEKVYVPVKDFPDYNFVGRILGPRGMTAKQLEQETGCKIMVRGKGSMRDKGKEDANRGKPNWEHLNDELHVLIQCEDAENRAAIKMKRGMEEVKKLLLPSPEGEDDLKRKQLLELAIINGTYRPATQGKLALPTMPRLLTPVAPQLRSPSLGAPIYLSPTARGPSAPAFATNGLALQSFLQHGHTAGLDFSAAAAGAFLVPMDQLLSLQAAALPYANTAAINQQLFGAEYAAIDSQAGAIQRRILNQSQHPYRRHDSSPGGAKSIA